jgi:hypothetical protein
MKFLSYGKDGGPDSTVWGYWLVEIKSLFSIALLCFENGSRDAYHDHAFNSVSWLLSGNLYEEELDNSASTYLPSVWPIVTPRNCFHRVTSRGRSWVLTFRGPWSEQWHELRPTANGGYSKHTLTDGRKEV